MKMITRLGIKDEKEDYILNFDNRYSFKIYLMGEYSHLEEVFEEDMKEEHIKLAKRYSERYLEDYDDWMGWKINEIFNQLEAGGASPVKFGDLLIGRVEDEEWIE